MLKETSDRLKERKTWRIARSSSKLHRNKVSRVGNLKYKPPRHAKGKHGGRRASLRGAALKKDIPSPTYPRLYYGYKNVNRRLIKKAGKYIRFIMDPNNTVLPGLKCSAFGNERYTYLRNLTVRGLPEPVKPSYFFALDLHNSISIIPRLLGSIIETIRYLGPENCALSVVDGRPDDGTYEVLRLLSAEMQKIGVRFFLSTSTIDPAGEDKGGGLDEHRIIALAELRNIALHPLVNHPEEFAPDPTVVSINDVAICMEDILELIHQRFDQDIDMTCAIDWLVPQQDAQFYDVWIFWGISGVSFFEVGLDGDWTKSWDLFWNDPYTQHRHALGQPFQVFACWNGAVAFTAKPFINKTIKLRSRGNKECCQGEPSIMAQEMWYHGYGKIAVVPSVNLAYDHDAAVKLKKQEGYVSDWADHWDAKIDWQSKPPALVKCMPDWEGQKWVPWDEGL